MSVDAAMVETLGHLLSQRHVGRENAARSPQLLAELAEAGLVTRRTRSIGEAVDVLLDRLVVCSESSVGYYVARTADEVERSLRETERRARRTLTRRRRLRARWLELLGQERVGGQTS